MYTREVYQQIASKIHAVANCIESDNVPWRINHTDSLDSIANEYLPSGSGIDSGCTIDLDNSTSEKIIISSGYHAMDDNGMYCGWIHFDVIITPSLEFDYNLEFENIENDSDCDNWQIESLFDYLHDVFSTALQENLPLI